MPLSIHLLLSALLLSIASVSTHVSADLRLASIPKTDFAIISPRKQATTVPFSLADGKTAPYMDPSTFSYAGLVKQKAKKYDNFLRSNVDNEQDRRNFFTEPGQDMLPFRTLNGESTAGPPLTLTIGEEHVVPLRWNNPHSSECEFNIWLTGTGAAGNGTGTGTGAAGNVVVPIKKPVCCGEGHQDGAIGVIVPADFNQLVSNVPGFTGCNKVGDCVLQLYAHSVETRTYAVGVPLLLKGGDNIAALPAATALNGVAAAAADVGSDLAKLPRDVCLSTLSPDSNMRSAQPRFARLISDVYNHAYQDSNYSPYSGQQPEAISRNLQAAAVLRLTISNGGELGRTSVPKVVQQERASLAAAVKKVVAEYEKAANLIINAIGKKMENSGQIDQQKLATCFRCAEAGATNAKRAATATYVPSFSIPPNLVDNAIAAIQADKTLPANAVKVISPTNVVQIYAQALADLAPQFQQAAAKGAVYQSAKLKDSIATLKDATHFRKIDAKGKKDNGAYATSMATKGVPPTPAPAVVRPPPPPAKPLVEAIQTETAIIGNAQSAPIFTAVDGSIF